MTLLPSGHLIRNGERDQVKGAHGNRWDSTAKLQSLECQKLGCITRYQSRIRPD